MILYILKILEILKNLKISVYYKNFTVLRKIDHDLENDNDSLIKNQSRSESRMYMCKNKYHFGSDKNVPQ